MPSIGRPIRRGGDSAAGRVIDALVESGARDWAVEACLARQVRKPWTWMEEHGSDMTWKPGWEQVSSALLTVGGPQALFRAVFEAIDDPATRYRASHELGQIAYSIRHRHSPSITSLVEITAPSLDMLITHLGQLLRGSDMRVRDEAASALRTLEDPRADEILRAEGIR